MKTYPFSALLSRMKYITRWSLMRSTRAESLSEHTADTALLASNATPSDVMDTGLLIQRPDALLSFRRNQGPLSDKRDQLIKCSVGSRVAACSGSQAGKVVKLSGLRWF